MLVPLSRKYALLPVPAMCHAGYVVERYDPRTSSDTSRVPGATTSGLTARSMAVGPRELYGATRSSDRVRVPAVSMAPTVMANGELPGEVMPPSTGAPVEVCP